MPTAIFFYRSNISTEEKTIDPGRKQGGSRRIYTGRNSKREKKGRTEKKKKVECIR